MMIVKCGSKYINADSIESFSIYYNDVKSGYCLLIDTGKNKYYGNYYKYKSLVKKELSGFCDFLLKESDGIFLLKI